MAEESVGYIRPNPKTPLEQVEHRMAGELLLVPEEITPIIAEEVEKHFKLYPDARLWITELAYGIYKAQLAKVLKHKLARPNRERIAKHLWRQRTPDKILRQGADWKYLTETTQAEFLEEADQILALIPSEEEIRKQQQVEDTAYYAEMMKVATDRVGKEARRDERSKIKAGGFHINVGQVLEIDGEKIKATRNQTLVLIPDEEAPNGTTQDR